MSRVADIWGILPLAGCAVAVTVHLILGLKKARAENRKSRFRALVSVCAGLTILAVLLIPTGHFYSLLITVGVLLPISAFVYSPWHLIVAVYRKTNVQQSLLFLLATGLLSATGIAAIWALVVPEPLIPAAQSLAPDLPVAEGWSDAPLQAAFRRADELGSLGVVVIHRGRIVVEWGNTDKVTDSHSVRKSILSVLIGIAIQKGLMDLDKTLEELAIDDKNPPLTPEERSATVEDLLRSSSGIYHAYVGDREDNPPAPGSHPPGTYFYYNNWDFNTLGAIFERESGYTIGRALKDWLADPIGMQDYQEEHVIYERFPYPNASYYPAYKIWISARDLARFGLLLARNGQWEGQQIVPHEWIKQSTLARSSSATFGYGYSWWRSLGYPEWLSEDTYLATGTAGQKLLIDPYRELVVAHRTDTRKGLVRAFYIVLGQRVNNEQFLSLTRMILDACPKELANCAASIPEQ